MNARRRATIGFLLSVVAALVTGTLAGLALADRPEAAGPVAGVDALVATARTRLVAALVDETRGLEREVGQAVQVPELRAALADHVDGPTIADLFDSEDWWAPYKRRDAAIVSGHQLLAVHGDKELPVPVGRTPAKP